MMCDVLFQVAFGSAAKNAHIGAFRFLSLKGGL